MAEYHDPLLHADLHDRLYISGSGEGILHTNEVAQLSKEYQAAVLSGHIPASQRFFHHKHNYDFNDWGASFKKRKSFSENLLSWMCDMVTNGRIFTSFWKSSRRHSGTRELCADHLV